MPNLEVQKITVDNICDVCESSSKPCKQPCDVWYDCLEGKEIDIEKLLCPDCGGLGEPAK